MVDRVVSETTPVEGNQPTHVSQEDFVPYSIYRDSGVEWLGEIPAHWETRQLKRLCTFEYGDSLSGDSRMDGHVDVYGSNGPIGSHNDTNTLGPCLVIGRKGSFGKVNYSCSAVFAIDTTFFVDCRHTDAQLRWLYYLLTVLGLDTATKDSAIPGLDREDAYAHIIPVCGLPEQRAVAAFLDRETAKIDALVAKKERLIELLQEKRTALISRAVTKGLDPNVLMKDSSVEWLGGIPAHWEVKRLKHVAAMRAGTGITGEDIEEAGDYPVFGGNGIRGYTYSFTHEGEYPLIGRQGALCGAIAVASGKFWASEHAIVVVPHNNVMPMWLAYGLEAMSLNRLSQSAAQPELSVDKIEAVPSPVPPLAEQRGIADFLNRETAKLDVLISKVRSALEHLKELRAALISEAVTGGIDVGKEAA